MMQTLFHDLLHVLHTALPDGTRKKLYLKILHVTQKHGINLVFLIGEDPEFDAAHEEIKIHD